MEQGSERILFCQVFRVNLAVAFHWRRKKFATTFLVPHVIATGEHRGGASIPPRFNRRFNFRSRFWCPKDDFSPLNLCETKLRWERRFQLWEIKLPIPYFIASTYYITEPDTWTSYLRSLLLANRVRFLPISISPRKSNEFDRFMKFNQLRQREAVGWEYHLITIWQRIISLSFDHYEARSYGLRNQPDAPSGIRIWELNLDWIPTT